MSAQIPPAIAADNIMRSNSPQCGRLPSGAIFNAKKLAAIAPMVIWPSPPMFQKRILKHGAIARAHPRRGTAIFIVCLKYIGLLNEPLIMVANPEKGLLPVVIIGMQPRRRAKMTLPMRIPHTYSLFICSRLASLMSDCLVSFAIICLLRVQWIRILALCLILSSAGLFDLSLRFWHLLCR